MDFLSLIIIESYIFTPHMKLIRIEIGKWQLKRKYPNGHEKFSCTNQPHY